MGPTRTPPPHLSRIYTTTPNLQKAVETNIPLLASILLAFVGALFIGVSVADIDYIKTKVDVTFILNWPIYTYTIPILIRRYWVMLFSLISGAFFYLCIESCVRSQVANFRDNAEITSLTQTLTDQAEIQELENRKQGWARERDANAQRALALYNIGIRMIFFPLLFFLPPEIFIIGFLLIIFLFWTRPK